MAGQAVRVVAASGSPFLKPVTSGDRPFDPAGGTQPVVSCHRIIGGLARLQVSGVQSWTTDTSEWQQPAPATLSGTPPLPGVGSGTSLRVGKVLNCSKTMAFISSLSSLKHFRSYAQGGECAHQHRCNKILLNASFHSFRKSVICPTIWDWSCLQSGWKVHVYMSIPPLRMTGREGVTGWPWFSLSGFYSRLIRAWVSSTVVAQEVASRITVWVASLRFQKSKATCLDSSSMRSLSRQMKVWLVGESITI